MLTMTVPYDVVPLLRQAINDEVEWYREQAPKSPGVCYAASADKLEALLVQLPDDGV